MSIRCGSTSLIPGAIVCGVPGLGVLGSTILATTGIGGSGPGILFNDVQTGDEDKEFRAEVLTWPSAGSLDLQEDGRFTFTGAASDSLTYRLWVDGVSIGTASVTLYGAASVTADVSASGAMSWTATGSAGATVIDPAATQADVAGIGVMAWSAAGAVSASILTAVAADVQGAAAMSWAATGALSAVNLQPIAADAQGEAAMLWSATGRLLTSDGSVTWPQGTPLLSKADATTYLSIAGR